MTLDEVLTKLRLSQFDSWCMICAQKKSSAFSHTDLVYIQWDTCDLPSDMTQFLQISEARELLEAAEGNADVVIDLVNEGAWYNEG